MSASESTDCYLCGARNDIEADFCVRCDGQLLKLPSDAIDIATTDATELIVDEVPDVDEDVVSRKISRRPRSGSVEDQRLSDALGLGDDLDDELMDTVVTSIPKASASANIPLIGTRTGMVSQKEMHHKEAGKRVYVLLGLLLLATMWLGWTTLTGNDDSTPDNLAFTNTTVPPTTTTTTVAERREWSEAEVAGKYGSAFTRVLLYDCPAETPEGAVINIEANDDMWSSGIAVDEHNVLLDSTDLPRANAAVVRSRTGTQRLALIGRGPDGTRLATTTSPISRNLALGEASDGEPAFHLSYDHETNVVEATTAPQGTRLELTVSNLGDLLVARVGRYTLDDSQLRSINNRIETVEEEDAPDPVTVCDRARLLQPAQPEPPTPSSEVN